MQKATKGRGKPVSSSLRAINTKDRNKRHNVRKLGVLEEQDDETDMTTSLRNYEAYQEYLVSLNSNDESTESLHRLQYVRTRHITDPVHGLVDVDTRLFCIIDTPEFQRLRRLHQLGVCFMV